MDSRVYLTDVALMSVTDTEYAAVKHFHDWKTAVVDGDEQFYEVAFFERDGVTHSLVHTRQDEMGMTAAAVTAMKLIYEFRPRYLIMVGIAAGVAKPDVEEQVYGDVIVPDIVWNYAAGKFVSQEKAEITFGKLGFLPRSMQTNIPEEVLQYVREATASPENECHVHIGPMACGTSVVANREILQKQVYTHLRNTAGLDMESYGVVYAARHASAPQPTPIIIKSVCDYANDEKGDAYQKFAAVTSCQFAKLLYEKHLPL